MREKLGEDIGKDGICRMEIRTPLKKQLKGNYTYDLSQIPHITGPKREEEEMEIDDLKRK